MSSIEPWPVGPRGDDLRTGRDEHASGRGHHSSRGLALGWCIYATNRPMADRDTTHVVLAYHDQ